MPKSASQGRGKALANSKVLANEGEVGYEKYR